MQRPVAAAVLVHALAGALPVASLAAFDVPGVTVADPGLGQNTLRTRGTLVDGSGFNAGARTHLAAPDAGTMWRSAATVVSEDQPVILDFALNGLYDLASIDIWNFNHFSPAQNHGVGRLDIFTSSDGLAYVSAIPTLVLHPGSGLDSYAGQSIDVLAFSTKFVRFRIVSGVAGGQGVGLSEVRFVAFGEHTPAVAPGDYNGNGLVDAADYTLFRDNLGGDAAAAFAAGSRDPLGSGGVNQSDYAFWSQNFGHAGGVAAVSPANPAVPETCAWATMLLAGAAALVRPALRARSRAV
ncbi:hypothetical protein Pla175_25510 [Pirellulimonas nuda]|uniref:F5/8 type C domain protein n=1 Tax=Pirellulimonas nuda TaxID=2528009 RepID=A0A518DCF6_9BACT|nr:hypothetical protein [Pirellulimonas nuda]QDU89164.1 hypothetical protein Pla175_25510 [Pirellulimonas nuda]